MHKSEVAVVPGVSRDSGWLGASVFVELHVARGLSGVVVRCDDTEGPTPLKRKRVEEDMVQEGELA